VRWLHHGEVVTTHNTVLHVLSTAKLTPTVVGKVGAVVEEPLHRRWVLILSWWWTWVTCVTGNTLTAPDGVCLDWLDRWLWLVGGKRANGGGEVRKEPLWGLAWVASAEETDLVEEDVETCWERVKVDWTRRVEEEKLLNLLVVGEECLSNSVGDDTTSGPTTNDVWSLRLTTLDLGEVDHRDGLNTALPALWVLHERAVQSKGANVRSKVWDADI